MGNIRAILLIIVMLVLFGGECLALTGNVSVEGKLDVTGNAAVSGKIGIGTTEAKQGLDIIGSMYSRRYSATVSIDWNNGNVQSLTLANGVNTLTFANGQDGGKYILILKQPASLGAGTVGWPGTVRWPGGTAPTLTTTNAKTDYIGFIYNGVDSKYDAVAITMNM